MTDVRAEIAAAMAAFRQGDAAGAGGRLERLVAACPTDPHALHALARFVLGQGRARAAAALLARATDADPGTAILWLTRAGAERAAGLIAEEVASLDRALAIDPYMLPALLQKAQAEERRGRVGEAVRIHRALAATTPDESSLPPDVRTGLAHGRALVAADDAARGQAIDAALDAGSALSARARAFADMAAGRRRVYWPQPSGHLFPFLPAVEYFDRALFPWFEELEAATDAIRQEFLALRRADRRFDPYVQFPQGVPVNQWAALNHSADWGAFFLWRDGARIDDNCASCPRTAAVMDRLPLIDMAGRGPTVMFSLLEPHTHIPPHTGTTNVRATVHLPLIVPPGCRFRVGGETRVWREGIAWAFDDTIEHEAWNDSDAPRAILIIDAWNPYLTAEEQAAVRAVTEALA